MRYAVLDSGLGLLGCAAALLDADSAAELVLAFDPDGMPYGARSGADVTARVRAMAADVLAFDPDAVIVSCNTASVHGLDALREDLEPAVPVIGTVPAIKPASAAGGPIAVWATPRTTGSAYQRGLIAQFAADRQVTEVGCPDLAEAVERADPEATAAAIALAAAATPPDAVDVVLGCTHYPLVAAEISRALGSSVRLHDSATAVAAQARRRASEHATRPPGSGQRLVTVRRSCRSGRLPESAFAYAEGRRLAALGTDEGASGTRLAG